MVGVVTAETFNDINIVGSWEVLKLQPTFQTKSENYGYSGGDLTVLLIVLGDGFSPRFNLRSRS